MKNKKILAANWKLNKSPKQAAEFFNLFLTSKKDLVSTANPSEKHFEFLFFPSAFCLEQTQKALNGSDIGYGPQNIYSQLSGAFTGENSIAVAAELGSTHVLVGHSERRQLFAETDNLLSEKLKLVLKSNLKCVFCIGETLEQRQGQKTEEILKQQIQEALKTIIADPELYKALKNQNEKIIFAYEPVWAIGTGLVATAQQVQSAHNYLYELLSSYGLAESPLLYGGSVKAENAKELSQIPHVDGFLVGGASLESKSFLAIAQAML